MPETFFGKSIKRREDQRLITGKGNFVDDVKIPFTTHAAFVRSPHAHARINKIDARTAKAMKGVLAVYTGKDLLSAGVKPIPVGWLLPGIKVPAHHPLAVDRVRYMGDAVAVVVAETPYIARDAAELAEVDYDVLPAFADGADALKSDAPKNHDEEADNVPSRCALRAKPTPANASASS